MTQSPIICPICCVALRADTTVCSGCKEDLALLVYVQSQHGLLYNKGLELAKAGDVPGAILALQQAEGTGGRSVAATTLLGKVYAQSGRYDDARLSWERVLLIEADSAGAASGLAALDAVERADSAYVRRVPSTQGEARWRAERDDERLRFVRLAGVFLLGAVGQLLLLRAWPALSIHVHSRRSGI